MTDTGVTFALAAEPLVAVRSWQIRRPHQIRPPGQQPALLSLTWNCPWVPRQPMVARCLRTMVAPAAPVTPDHDCTCGIYALDPAAISRIVTGPVWGWGMTTAEPVGCWWSWSPPFAVGLVAVWGRVYIHEGGILRATKAYPLVLFDVGGRFLPPNIEDVYGVTVLPSPRTPGALVEMAEWARSHLLREVTAAEGWAPPLRAHHPAQERR